MRKVILSLLLVISGASGFAQTTTFSYADTNVQTYVVPAGVVGLAVDAIGGCGGGAYVSFGSETPVALGGRVQCTLAVTPGQTLYIYVGGGVTGFDWSSNVTGGFNGGGTSGTFAGAGGGATDIRLSAGTISGNKATPYTATNRIIVAGGGGGGGDFSAPGGLGGGTTGGDGGLNVYGFSGTAGSGGTPTGPGPNGFAGALGVGGNGSSYSGGGGGGGLYGGNGANGYNGGGGGSSYTDPTLCSGVVHTQGYSGANGNGSVTLTVTCYAAGPISGSVPVCSGSTITLTDTTVGGTWSSSDITTATVGSTSGIVTGVAGGTATITYTSPCGSMATAVVTVNQTPTVNPTSNQILCSGSMTTAITFTGSVAGAAYNWSETGPGIGLATSGSGNIAAFTASNTTALPDTDVVTVFPSYNGCTGGSNTFTIIVNPLPQLTSSITPPAICDGTTFSYTPTSATPGTSYIWSRAAVTGISEGANSGSGNPAETLNDTTAGPVSVVYVYTLTANGCSDSQGVTVTVNPTPTLTTSLTPPSICDSTTFAYTSNSATPGTSFSWSRAAVVGISNPATSGTGVITEVLNNTTPNPVVVTYVDTLKANGCMNTEDVMVTVNPKPTLSSPLTIAPICDSSMVMYVSMSATTGTTFKWTRGAIGINPAASGADTIRETLYDTSANPIVVMYNDTLMANGCWNAQVVTVTVNPTPVLSSTLTPAGICDSALFNYTPTSRTVGSAFAWYRPFVIGIGDPAATGTGVIAEYLKNNTNDNLTVNYVYTVTANGCHHIQDVSFTVHPTPTLSSPLTWSSCSGNSVNYLPSGYTFGSSFAWSRANVAGIKPATGSGTGNILESLTDTALVPLTAVYVVTVTANGCSHVQNIRETVNPMPPSLTITTHSPSNLCSNTMFQNFGVAAAPPSGQNYHWTATNAEVWAQGANKQYCLVNFDHPGVTAVVTLNSNVTGFGCVTNSSFIVNVSSSVSDNPQVVYYQGQFLCLQTDEDNFQWGYDDNTTLDSTLISGENNANYINFTPDFANRHYWVITNKNGCMQKTYYNVPQEVVNMNGDVSLKVYPNPANSVLNVSINTTLEGSYQLDVVNMLGQKLTGAEAQDHKASINVANLPAGCYIVDCYRDGVKAGSVRFIKN